MAEEETHRGPKKREHDELGPDYLRNKGYNVVEIHVRDHSREIQFPTQATSDAIISTC